MAQSCPYCSYFTFACNPVDTAQRHPELALEDETEWLNKCAMCNKWALYKDVDGCLYELVDPDDPSSEEVG